MRLAVGSTTPRYGYSFSFPNLYPNPMRMLTPRTPPQVASTAYVHHGAVISNSNGCAASVHAFFLQAPFLMSPHVWQRIIPAHGHGSISHVQSGLQAKYRSSACVSGTVPRPCFLRRLFSRLAFSIFTICSLMSASVVGSFPPLLWMIQLHSCSSSV
jgi:nitrate reductase NapE component